MAVTHTIFLAVIFSTLICGGHSIRCFYCNSANNSACVDVNLYDGETIARLIPVVECAVTGPSTPNFFCRKIVQTIYHSGHESEYRVTRNCGWIRGEDALKDKPCYNVRNADHSETVCQCFSDRCNPADSVDPASSVFIFLVLAAVLYFYR